MDKDGLRIEVMRTSTKRASERVAVQVGVKDHTKIKMKALSTPQQSKSTGQAATTGRWTSEGTITTRFTLLLLLLYKAYNVTRKLATLHVI